MAREYFLKSTAEPKPEKQIHPGWNSKLRTDRDLDVLVGLCKGIIADGKVNEAEIASLSAWFLNHKDVFRERLGTAIHDRIRRIYADGIVTDVEREDLRVFLEQAVGGDPTLDTSSALDVDVPPPVVTFTDQRFCFTGKFVSGSRDWCQKEVVIRYGMISENVALDTSYLVLGSLAARDWIHSASGRKLQRAVELRNGGAPVRIITESHWLNYLDETPTDADIADGSAGDPINAPEQ